MSLFSTRPRFNPVDPLGDGLGELIAQERTEQNRIELTEYANAQELEAIWNQIHQDLVKDPLWFSEDWYTKTYGSFGWTVWCADYARDERIAAKLYSKSW